MTLSALKRDPWIAVVMPLPKLADVRLLAAARCAARLCEREGRAALASSQACAQEQTDEMRFIVHLSSTRINEINLRAAERVLRRLAHARLGLG